MSDIRAGQAYVELTTRDRTQAGLRAVQERLGTFSARVREIGSRLSGLTDRFLAPLKQAGELFRTSTGPLAELSVRTGESAAKLSVLLGLFEATGGSVDTLETALERSREVLREAASGSVSARNHLAQLGLTVDQLRDRDAVELFDQLAQGLDRVADPALRAELAAKLFGSASERLFVQTGEYARLRTELAALNPSITQAEADQARQLTMAYAQLGAATRRLKTALGAIFTERLAKIVEAFALGTSLAVKWVDANRPLIAQTVRLVSVTALVGGGLVALSRLGQIASVGLGWLPGLFAETAAVGVTASGKVASSAVKIAGALWPIRRAAPRSLVDTAAWGKSLELLTLGGAAAAVTRGSLGTLLGVLTLLPRGLTMTTRGVETLVTGRRFGTVSWITALATLPLALSGVAATSIRAFVPLARTAGVLSALRRAPVVGLANFSRTLGPIRGLMVAGALLPLVRTLAATLAFAMRGVWAFSTAFSGLGLLTLSAGAGLKSVFHLFRAFTPLVFFDGGIFKNLSKAFSFGGKSAVTGVAGAMRLLRASLAGIGTAGVGILTLARGLFSLASIGRLTGSGFAALTTLFPTLLSPLTLVVGGLAVLGIVLWKTGLAAQAWQQLQPLLSGVLSSLQEKFSTFAGWLGQLWNTLQADTLAAFAGIKAALEGGDWKLAGQIVWATLKLEFLKGTQALTEEWNIWKTAFLNTFAGWGNDLASLWVDVWARVQTAWFTGLDALEEKIAGVQQRVASTLARWLAKLQGLDPDEVEQTLREDADRAKQARQPKQQQRLNRIEDDRQTQQEALAQQRQQTEAGNNAALARSIDESGSELKQAQDEFKNLIAGAKDLKPQGLLAEFLGKTGTKSLTDAAEQFDDRCHRAASVAEQGTFSAFALGTLVSSSPAAERTAKATEETAQGVKKLDERLARHTFVFAPG